MAKIAKYIFLIVIVVLADQFLQRLLPLPLVSILIPVVLFMSSKFSLLESLQLSFILGFSSDVILLNRLPIYTLFLTTEATIVWYLSKKYVEFRNLYIFGIASMTLILVSYTIMFILAGYNFDIYVAAGIFTNIFLAIIVYSILRPSKIEGAYEQ